MDIRHHEVVSIEIKVVGKCKFCCLYINKSTKERCMFRFFATYCFSAVEYLHMWQQSKM